MPTSRSEPAPARFSRFRLVRDLGTGAQGTVHEAIDVERDVRVALKTLRSVGAEEIVRLKTEFRSVRDLQHPNLVRLGELSEDAGRWFFTMELVDGVDFLAYVRDGARLEDSTSWPTRVESGPRVRALGEGLTPSFPSLPVLPVPPSFDEAHLRAAFAQLSAAIAFLHRAGKVHCDLKPSNVLVDRSGRVVLIDFGIVAEFAHADDEGPAMVGTVPYMAPEQVLGVAVGPAADWYAAGVLLFEALTGRHPFEGETRDVMERKCLLDAPRASELSSGVPEDLDALCAWLLSREPDERPTDEEALRAIGVADDQAAPPIFVGRRAEIAALEAALDTVRDGRLFSVVLEGESGVGKSALARRFLEEARRDEPRMVVLEGRCHEQERVPYNAFDATLDGLARFLRARRASTLAALLPPDADRLRRVFPALGGLTDGRGSVSRAEGSRAERDEAFAVLREVLRRVAAIRTLVVVLEDVQWADADSLALLAALTEPPNAPAMLIVATAWPRPDGGPSAAVSAMRGDTQRIAVSGLDPHDAADLLEHLLTRRSAAPTTDASSLLESSRGHPMFLEELARYLGSTREVPRSATLDDAVWARAEELDPATREVLRAVAVAGQPTPQIAIAEALGIPFGHYAERAATLRAARLVRVRGPRPEDPVEPYHDRVREALYARLDPSERAAIHRALGETLERRGAPPELLDWHFAAAGDEARALRYGELAAEAAMRAYAFDRAAALYRRVLAAVTADAGHRRRLLVGLGQALVDAGRSKDAGEAFLEASRTGTLDEPARLELLRRAGESFLVGGHLDPGLDAIREVLAAHGLSLPRARLVALARLGWAQLRVALHPLTWTSRTRDALDRSATARVDLCWSVAAGLALVDSLRSILFIDTGLLLALDLGDDGRAARALGAASMGDAGLGRRAQAARLGEACHRAALAAGTDDARFYDELVGVSHRFFLENDWRGTLEGARTAQGLLRATGRTEGWENDVVEQLACWSIDNAGRLSELRARVPARIRSAQRAGNRFIEVNFRTQFVNLYLMDDRPADARREVQDAIASWPRVDDQFGNQDYLALRSLTQIAVYEGEVPGVSAMRREWKRYFSSLLGGVVFLRQDALFWAGAIALVEAKAVDPSKRARALREAERAIRSLRAIDLPMAASNALQLETGLTACRGDDARTREALERALADADARGLELVGTCYRWRLAEVAAKDGRALRAEADAWLAAQPVKEPERLVRSMLPGF